MFIITYNFAVRGCPGMGGQNVTVPVNGSTRAFNITVEENSDVIISILARNEAGDSQPNQTRTVTSIAGRPPTTCTAYRLSAGRSNGSSWFGLI